MCIISQKQLAKKFNVSPAAVRKWIRYGKLNESIVKDDNGAFLGIDQSKIQADFKRYESAINCIKCDGSLNTKNQKLCDNCRDIKEVICLGCKNSFMQNDFSQKYCSTECMKKEQKPIKPKPEKKERVSVIHICVHCTKHYSCGEGWCNTYYCSIECRSEHYKRSCGNCGKSFVSKKPAKYCSRSCAFEVTQAIKLSKEDKICDYCGGEYQGIKEQKYCCEACKYLGYQETLKDNLI